MILLDTCVISELAKPAPDPAVLAWFEGVRDDALWLSVLTVGEIKKGADLLDAGTRKDRVDAWLSDLRATFGDRVRDQAAEQRSGSNGVIVTRDDVINYVGVTVGVHHGHDRQA